MSTIRYEPWSLLNQLQRELERSIDTRGPSEGSVSTAEWTPAVDIKEKTDGYLLYADVPGVKPENIDITMENGILTIKGARETEAHAAKEGYKRIERVHGSFYRRFSLPDTADAEGITAKCANGVLETSSLRKPPFSRAKSLLAPSSAIGNDLALSWHEKISCLVERSNRQGYFAYCRHWRLVFCRLQAVSVTAQSADLHPRSRS